MNIRLSFLLLYLFLPAGLAPTDLSRLKEVGDARFSPDGTRIVYVVGETASDRTRVNSTRTTARPTSGCWRPTARPRGSSRATRAKVPARAGRPTASGSPSTPTGTARTRSGSHRPGAASPNSSRASGEPIFTSTMRVKVSPGRRTASASLFFPRRKSSPNRDCLPRREIRS